MSETAIKIENLSKVYRIGSKVGKHNNFREAINDFLFSRFRRLTGKSLLNDAHDTIWALDNVSFEVKQGEVLGIIGRNGSGKTTLLKILSRITEPSKGRAEISGRVASLLEVGTGFHPELTGRDNIFLNGGILGMTRREIKSKFDEIVAFSEIEKFIDTPVKRYSSGMYVRLAFAVAAHMEPEILLIDEVLAVGDASFQKKCLGKMGDVARGGRTVLFVSHNMGAISQLCGQAVLLENGKVRSIGEARKIIKEYFSSQTIVKGLWKRSPESTSFEGSEVQILTASVLSQDGQEVSKVEVDKPFQVEVKYEVTRDIRWFVIVLQIIDGEGRVLLTSWETDRNEIFKEPRMPGVYSSICKFPAYLIRAGIYSLTLAAHIPDVKILDFHESVLGFEMVNVGNAMNENRVGIIMPLLDWKLQIH